MCSFPHDFPAKNVGYWGRCVDKLSPGGGGGCNNGERYYFDSRRSSRILLVTIDIFWKNLCRWKLDCAWSDNYLASLMMYSPASRMEGALDTPRKAQARLEITKASM